MTKNIKLGNMTLLSILLFLLGIYSAAYGNPIPDGYQPKPYDGQTIIVYITTTTEISGHSPETSKYTSYSWIDGTASISGVSCFRSYASGEGFYRKTDGVTYISLTNDELRWYGSDVKLSDGSTLSTRVIPYSLNYKYGKSIGDTYSHTYKIDSSLCKEVTQSTSVTYKMLGYETITTPYGTYRDSLKYSEHVKQTSYYLGKSQGTVESDIVYWNALNIGLVKMTNEGEDYKITTYFSYDIKSNPPSYGPPEVVTTPVSSITSSSATLHGTVNPNGLSTTYYFDYGKTTGYGNKTTYASAGSGKSAVSVSTSAHGLEKNTTYHYRLVATNKEGASYGTNKTFTTLAEDPAPDTKAPDTMITSGPDEIITGDCATFIYTGSDDKTATASLVYSCKLDGYDSSWSSYSATTSKNYTGLPVGSYTFYVRAKDAAGNVDSSPASKSFTIFMEGVEGYNFCIPYFLSNMDYWTGIGIKNISIIESASVTVINYANTGSIISVETKTLPPRGQTAFMMKSGEGWVKVKSDQKLSGLGFVAMTSDEKLMFDITLAPEFKKILYVPHVAQDGTWDTIIYVCNPNNSATTMYLSFIKSDGTVAKVSQGYTLQANGSGKYPLSFLLGGSAYSSGSVEITASQGVAAFALYENLKSGDMSYAGISAIASEEEVQDTYIYYLPYFISDNSYWTGVGLRNVSTDDSVSIMVDAYGQDGTLTFSQPSIVPSRGQRAFMLNKGEGWAKLTSDQPLTGLGFIAMAQDERLMFDIPFESVKSKILYVPHVAQDATWDTIIYVCNPNGSETIMYLTFVKSDGTVVTCKKYTLPPDGSGKYPLSNVLGGILYSSGSIEITASQGVVAFALYNNLKTGDKSYAGISAVDPTDTSKDEKKKGSITNSIGMTFVQIPAGTFTMGSPSTEADRSDNETMHQVTLTKSFYLQTTEVTQGQWKEVMGSNPSYFSNCGDNCPVENVSWNDCQAFINQLNQLEGSTKYRLPTEAEWEYACRAGTTTPFNTGSCLSTDQVNYDGNFPYTGCPSGTCRQTPVAVKSFSPNAWGLYDMHGNVWEWCLDFYGTYPSSSVTDPRGPSSGEYPVFRGGGWRYKAKYCRSAFRDYDAPIFRFNGLGFRVARDN